MTTDITNNYKITVSINVHILPYLEDDEGIRDCVCYDTLPQMKTGILERLEEIKTKVNKLTMKQVKEGVQF